jgi:hypothetical protein
MPHIMRLSLVLHNPRRNALRVSDMCLVEMKNDSVHLLIVLVDKFY